MIEKLINYMNDKNKPYVIFNIDTQDCKQSIKFYKTFPNSKIYIFECNKNTIHLCEKNIIPYQDRITLIKGSDFDYSGNIDICYINDNDFKFIKDKIALNRIKLLINNKKILFDNLVSNLEMFCVYHKHYYFREDNFYFTFFGVNEVYSKEKTCNNILEYKLDKYNPFLQKRGYMETSVYLHVYWNKLYKNKDMIGFSQYDMKHNQIYNNLDKKTIYLLNTNKQIVQNDKWNILMFPNIRNLDFLIKSYNTYFNKKYTIKELEMKPLSLWQTNIYPVKIYEKLCGWLEKLVDEIYPWSNQPPYETHFGSIGGYTERALAIFNAFEIYEGVPYSNLNIQHGIGGEEKEQYNHKSFLNNYSQDVHCKIVEEINDTKNYCIVGIENQKNTIIKENIKGVTKLFYIDEQENKSKPLMIIGNCNNNTFKWKDNILDCNLDDYEIYYNKYKYNYYNIIIRKMKKYNDNSSIFNSTEYWQNRYTKGENSGSGSYGVLAQWKAEIINHFINENKVKSIIDYGVGDGNQLLLLNTTNTIYCGIDVSKTIIDKISNRYKNDTQKSFHHISSNILDFTSQLVISCDVLYHLIEDNVYINYLNNLFRMSEKYVIIYANAINQNHKCEHLKFRNFIIDIEKLYPEWKLINFIPNKYPIIDNKETNNQSFSDFFIYEKKGKKKNLYDNIYISLTSIFGNQDVLLKTLQSILHQTKLPDKIFIYLSSEPFLQDIGFKNKEITNINLNNLFNRYKDLIEIKWVDNIGSYRKLIPILEEKIITNENSIIITIDDDVEYNKDLIKEMVDSYLENECVVSCRTHNMYGMDLCNNKNISYEDRENKFIKKDLYNFHTGKGAVLYPLYLFRDRLVLNKKMYSLIPTTDDIWFNYCRILNNIDCVSLNDNFNFLEKDNETKFGLSINYNCGKNHGKNTKDMNIILNELKINKYRFPKKNSFIELKKTDMIYEPAVKGRILYTEQTILNIEKKLNKKIKILDLGGNNFDLFCKKNDYTYIKMDLDKSKILNQNGGHFLDKDSISYDGLHLLDAINEDFDLIIVNFVLHHTFNKTLSLIEQIKQLTKYIIIGEDIMNYNSTENWKKRCNIHQPGGIFRSNNEWEYLFNFFNLNIEDKLIIICDRDKEFSNPYKHIYRMQYTLTNYNNIEPNLSTNLSNTKIIKKKTQEPLIIVLYGLKRSGNHYLISTIVNNFSNYVHINNTDLSYEEYLKYKEIEPTSINSDFKWVGFKDVECLIISIENKQIDYNIIDKFNSINNCHFVLLIRCPYTNFSSIWKHWYKNKNNLLKSIELWKIYSKHFIENNSFIKILYDEYSSNIKYRDNILKILGIPVGNNKTTENIKWQKSSYDKDESKSQVYRTLETCVYNDDKDFINLVNNDEILSLWNTIKHLTFKNKITCFSYSNNDKVYNITFPSIKTYCEQHDYQFIAYHTNLENKYKLHWNKLHYSIKLLKETNSEYIVWFDHDIVIKNYNIKLEDIISKYNFNQNDALFMMSLDPASNHPFNTGVIVFKNNQYTLNVFQEFLKMRNNPNKYPLLNKYGGFNFNTGMQDTRVMLAYFYENKDILLSIPHKVLQSFYGQANFYSTGDFCGHVAGPQGEVLISKLNELLNYENFDIVIPVGPNDKSVIEEQIKYTKKNIIGYRNIYLICYDPLLIIDGCITINENIFPFNIETVAKHHGKLNRNGWYLQQLLKLYAGKIVPDILDKYLVIDSDTFFLKPTTFVENNKCLYNYGTEYHKPYFHHMEKIDKNLTRFYEDKSGICHHMIFETKYIDELIYKIEKNHNELFYNVFLKKVIYNTASGASEYEIYFNYMLKYNFDKIKIRKLNWKNTNKLETNNNYDYISYHWHMR